MKRHLRVHEDAGQPDTGGNEEIGFRTIRQSMRGPGRASGEDTVEGLGHLKNPIS